MPQLDLATYFGVIISTTIFFFFFFILLIQFFLPIVLSKFLSIKRLTSSYTNIQIAVNTFSLCIFTQDFRIALDLYTTMLDQFSNYVECVIYLGNSSVEKSLNAYVFDLIEESETL